MIENLNQEIDACKRRMSVVRAFIAKTKAAGNASTESELQLELETELLRRLEAQLLIEHEV
ncbi:MAG: hypothetical protein WAO08_19535 [Hyphomicrobiaceae bacterium]